MRRRCETLEIAEAFRDRKRLRMRRTECDGEAVYLFGNCIAYWDKHGVPWVTMCGWDTATTRDRLNSICSVLGYGRPFRQTQGLRGGRDGIQWFNDRVISTYEHIPVCGPLGALAIQAERELLAAE